MARGSPKHTTSKSLREARRIHIENILKETGFNIPEAAHLLAIQEQELRGLITELKIVSDAPSLAENGTAGDGRHT